MVSEGLVVEFEAFKFDAEFVGDVGEGDGAEVGVACFRAERGELFGDVLDGVVAVGRGVIEALKDLGIGHWLGVRWLRGYGCCGVMVVVVVG